MHCNFFSLFFSNQHSPFIKYCWFVSWFRRPAQKIPCNYGTSLSVCDRLTRRMRALVFVLRRNTRTTRRQRPLRPRCATRHWLKAAPSAFRWGLFLPYERGVQGGWWAKSSPPRFGLQRCCSNLSPGSACLALPSTTAAHESTLAHHQQQILFEAQLLQSKKGALSLR